MIFVLWIFSELMKTVDPSYVPTKDKADETVNDLLSQNSGYSSFSELSKVSASHQQPQDLSEVPNSQAIQNTTEGKYIAMCLHYCMKVCSVS